MSSLPNRLPALLTIKEIIKLYKLRAKKQLSQNFILDNNISRKIVKAAGNIKNGSVCEVGPGPGGISRAILESGAAELVLIEKDERFFQCLQDLNIASGNRIKIHHGDVLYFNMYNIFSMNEVQPWHESPPNIHIIGNLPFSVSTPLIIRWLRDISRKEGAWSKGRVKLTLTFQKEVAERMVASIMKDNRCRLSVICQNWCHVHHSFTLPGSVFVPEPEVDVGVVHFIPRIEPIVDLPFEIFEKLLRHVFHYRRKMCKRGIQTLFPHDRPELTKKLLEEADIHSDSRSFSLSVEDFGRLTRVYKEICDSEPSLFEYDYRTKDNAKLWRESLSPLDI